MLQIFSFQNTCFSCFFRSFSFFKAAGTFSKFRLASRFWVHVFFLCQSTTAARELRCFIYRKAKLPERTDSSKLSWLYPHLQWMFIFFVWRVHVDFSSAFSFYFFLRYLQVSCLLRQYILSCATYRYGLGIVGTMQEIFFCHGNRLPTL